ncbi:oxygen-insensitive NADPH nitroreductase [Desulfosarcina ovata]|uniref:NADPH-dependent oxidoreductase n=1 Tax=Desulfosarcina ovata subsp. ovata TaxID=2752305 RepID=A0A5K8ADD5_9BACT|nr:oxygen-insensitive NADPH nitroreductase [Desulfosarcina ovata]BBO90004.1 NADPH-dependent oxidoreductase [Desulfosarcina ovata subsp. ovata]
MTPTMDQMRAHRSIRKFTDRTVDDDTVQAIVSAAQGAATSHFVQAYTVIQVKDQEKRTAIAQLSGPQAWVEQAPVFLVFCADLSRLETACDMQAGAMEKGWAEQFVTATVDVALLAQNVLLAAESLGMGGVFIGGIRNDPQTVCDLLAIPDQAYPVFGMCLGWPAHDPPPKPRLPVEAVLFTDRYPETHDRQMLSDYDRIINHYYLHRNSNLRDETWTRQMADFMGRIIRPHMKAFLEKRGLFLK